MKNRVVITTNQILWTIILLNTSSDDWYIDYINDKLNYQIKLNDLEENINILILDKIEDIQDSENLGEYLNIINNGDISDNYIKTIYNNLEKTKKNCLCFSGIYKSKDGDYVFNQKEENSEEIFIPINKMNPIKKEFILKKFNNYIEGEFKKISAKFIDDILVYIDSDIDLNKTTNQETKEPFSIILTAYKTEKFIEECLDSIESQTYFENNDNYEILVGVDGCENTLNKLNEIKDKYRNLYIYMMKENRGTYMTTNALLNLIKYENVIRFDTDDIMEPNLVEDLVDFKNINDDDVIKLGYSDWREGKKINDYVLVNDGIIYFKKSVMDDIAGGYMPWECAADSELISRLKGRVKISGLNKRLFIRRIHDNNLTLRKDTGYKSVKRLKYNNQIKGKYNDDEVKIERVSNNISEHFFTFINNNTKKELTVVIPNKFGQTPEVTIGSLRLQTFKNFDVVVINDYDNNANIARNKGLKKVLTPYVLFSDNDINWKNHALEDLINCLKNNLDISIAYGAYEIGDKIISNVDWDENRLKKRNYISTMSMVRTKDHPDFDEKIKRFQDWDVWLTMIDKGKKGKSVGKLIFSTTIRPDGITYGSIPESVALDIVKKKHMEKEKKPTFDIIIPSWNMSDLCLKCLKSIKTHSSDYRIIFIDNASEKDEFDKIHKELKNINHVLIKNTENLGFVKAVNQGIKKSTADYIIIMNNDTEAVSGWLEKLVQPLIENPKIGASGPLTTTPNSWQGQYPKNQSGYEIRRQGMLAFFCTMFKKEIFEKIGLLDEGFGVGFGDDDDYCKRILDGGYHLALVQDLIIPHHHRSTFKKIYSEDNIKNMQTEALKKFKNKHKL